MKEQEKPLQDAVTVDHPPFMKNTKQNMINPDFSSVQAVSGSKFLAMNR